MWLRGADVALDQVDDLVTAGVKRRCGVGDRQRPVPCRCRPADCSCRCWRALDRPPYSAIRHDRGQLSLTDCSSSFDVSTLVVDCNSSLIDCISSLEDLSSSLASGGILLGSQFLLQWAIGCQYQCPCAGNRFVEIALHRSSRSRPALPPE